MKSLNDYINVYKKQVEKGDIIKAYRGLMWYMRNLRSYFQNKYPDYFVSGNIYQGYMDMTYFSFTPQPLKKIELKIALVLMHDTVRFEVWLAGNTRKIRDEYRNLIKTKQWTKYPIPTSEENPDAIIVKILEKTPNFDEINSLTKKIEKNTNKFIEEVLEFIGGEK